MAAPARLLGFPSPVRHNCDDLRDFVFRHVYELHPAAIHNLGLSIMLRILVVHKDSDASRLSPPMERILAMHFD